MGEHNRKDKEMKCRWCDNEVPADLEAYRKCGDCWNAIADNADHIRKVKDGNEWAKIARQINRDAGALMVNG